VTIFALTDRVQAVQAAAFTTILLQVTLIALVGLGRIRGRAALRQSLGAVIPAGWAPPARIRAA
jgi:hypothetical protein